MRKGEVEMEENGWAVILVNAILGDIELEPILGVFSFGNEETGIRITRQIGRIFGTHEVIVSVVSQNEIDLKGTSVLAKDAERKILLCAKEFRRSSESSMEHWARLYDIPPRSVITLYARKRAEREITNPSNGLTVEVK